MRFALLAATAAACLSGQAEAATWVFDVTGQFNVSIDDNVTVFDPNIGANVIQTTRTGGVIPQTYRLSIGSTGAATVTTGQTTFAGFTFLAGRSFITTIYRIVGGQVFFDTASFQGDSGQGTQCTPGPVGCRRTVGTAFTQTLVGSFVSSSDATVPVPEPTTWAMMIVGFGAVGVAMRFRSRKSHRLYA